ncbi:MAG: hypothetical protein KBE22_00105 [Candidatus Accumulibacter sp.]|nr:hypothetical protein [Accumulibacter sp.]
MPLDFTDEEKADLEARAIEADMSFKEFLKLLVLTTAYGRFYPSVRAFWNRAMLGISGPKIKGDKNYER